MKKNRIVALVTAFAVMLCFVSVVGFSAEVPDVSGLEEAKLDAPAGNGISSSDEITEGNEGFIYSIQGSDFEAAKYLKAAFTVSGEMSADTNVFCFKPFDSKYGGWNDNYFTLGDATKEGDTYTLYVSVADIVASLGTGFPVMGINIYYATPPEGVVVTLTEYSYLSEPTGLPKTARGWLEYSVNYAKAMDPAKYREDSFNSFKNAITTAEGVLNNASAKDAQFQTARDNLEKAKAKLLFKDSTDPGNPRPFRVLSGEDTVKEMGVGWNLGNTMDGHAGFHPGETAWQQFTTTKEMIKAVHDAGFNTVRIPVTWGDMIDDENGYAINDGWISRVQDIVDYCVEQDMYAIINIHHDGADGWLAVGSDNIDYVYEKFEGVWRNIAERFKDYDEHLIFESINELTCTSHSDDNKNSSEAQKKDTPIIMNLNQIFVNTVRATGSNNTKRWLGSLTHFASRGTSNGFALPTDSYNSENRLMFSHHVYKDTSKKVYTWDGKLPTPDSNATVDPNNTAAPTATPSVGSAKATTEVIQQAHNKFKDVPVILGEYGYRNNSYSGNPSGFNDIGRAYVYECATRASQVGMTVPVVWDDSRGAGQDLYETGVYTVWDRESNKPVFKTITDAMMRGMFLEPSAKNKNFDMSDIVSNPEIIPITEIDPGKTEVTLEVGGSEKLTPVTAPDNTNDVVIWKSEDDNIATVYNGLIQGSRIGTTYVTAYSQSGSVETKIKVVVKAKKSENPAAEISVSENYEVAQDDYVFINAKADNGENLLYYSSNENVATVSAEGKLVGIAPGSTYITISAESGYTVSVPVVVTEKVGEKKINVAANVLYNGKEYNGTERGKPVTISSDGQYTVSFDLNSDLSDAGKKAGITEINNFGSLYLKDYDVDMGGTSKSPIEGCEIRWDEIKVNDIPLTITDSNFKSALNGAVFDTGNPFNAWDGSAVSDNDITVDKKNYVINFNLLKYNFDDTKAVVENGKVSRVEADVNRVPADNPLTAIVSVYDSENVLIETDSKQFSTSDIIGNKLNVEGFNLDVPEGGSAKAFIWSDLGGIKPFAVENESEIISPTKIDITFTIRNLTFPEAEAGKPATGISASSNTSLNMTVGDTIELKVNVTPADSTSYVSFIPSNCGIILPDNLKGKLPAKDGSCAISVTAANVGEAKVTAVTDNGHSVIFNINVK